MFRLHKRHTQPFGCVPREAGALALALCLILPVILSLLFSVRFHLLRSLRSLDAVRCAEQTAEAALARYDRTLYETFGVFGLQESSLAAYSSSLMLPDGFVQTITSSSPLSEGAPLKRAVLRHMALRAPMQLIGEAMDRLDAQKQSIPESWCEKLDEIDSNTEKELNPNVVKTDDNDEWYDDYIHTFDTEFRRDYQETMASLMPVQLAGTSLDEETQLNPVAGDGLNRLGALIDTVMTADLPLMSDRLVMTEYVLAYCGSRVPSLKDEGKTVPYCTPDGRTHASFEKLRHCEQEMLATGKRENAALITVKAFIDGTRMALHLAHILSDANERAIFDGLAAALVASISVVTLGVVNLPPQPFSYAFMAMAAAMRGMKDGNNLIKGKTVAVWPGQPDSTIRMSYRDYMRILLLTQHPDVLAQRLASIIYRVTGRHFMTAVTCHVKEIHVPAGREPQDVTVSRTYYSGTRR